MVCVLFAASSVVAAPTVIVIEGAAGADEFAPQFAQWREGWIKAAKSAEATLITIGVAKEQVDKSDKELIKESLAALTGKASDELWIVLLGHGTYDGKTARFNLRGPDVSADELAAWLDPVDRPVAVINCSSASGPFIAKLSGGNRVSVTATRSGNELNFSRFGGFLSQAIAQPTADLDKDGQTSLLEAYLLASRQTEEWYREEGRLATEHALIDDNADGLGTPAQWFTGVRAVRKSKDDKPLDGLRVKQWCLIRSESERKMVAELRNERDAIEMEMETLRAKKTQMSEAEYYAALEKLAVKLARVYEEVEK